MVLKSLEVQGFKSFPDKTLIRFGDDITAIVGPNGSGKSNISDASLWVMGEQSSKTLRGAKMEDVIFGGTQKRKAVGFAEATLTLDNSDRALPYDADEVTQQYPHPLILAQRQLSFTQQAVLVREWYPDLDQACQLLQ
ncbi:MAG: AAA family ATPase [Clostridia bacterium]|nr:AAA family ATPase [Clostridia bacterium]